MIYCVLPSVRTRPATAACHLPTPSPNFTLSRAGAPSRNLTRSRSAESTRSRSCAGCTRCAGSTVDAVAAAVGCDLLLPHRRHRRHPGALARRVPAPAVRAGRVAHTGPIAPAVRGDAAHRPLVAQRVRLRRPVAMLGLLGCASSRCALPASATSARSTATRFYESAARPTKAVLVPLPPAVAWRSTEPSANAQPVRSCPTAPATEWIAAHPRSHAAAEVPGPRRRHQNAQNAPSHVEAHLRDHHARCRDQPPRHTDNPRHADPRTTIRYEAPARTSTTPQLHPGRIHGLRHLIEQGLKKLPFRADEGKFSQR
jgi:hypothetical protein